MQEQSYWWLGASIFINASPANGRQFQCCFLCSSPCLVKEISTPFQNPDMQGGRIYNVDDQIPLIRHTLEWLSKRQAEREQNTGTTHIVIQGSSAAPAVWNDSQYKPCWWGSFPPWPWKTSLKFSTCFITRGNVLQQYRNQIHRNSFVCDCAVFFQFLLRSWIKIKIFFFKVK